VHQDGGVTVEVGDGEDAFGARGEEGVLVGQVGGAEGEDRAGGRRRVAEPLEIGFRERARPGEGLAAYEPGPVAVPFRFCHLRQAGGHPLDVFEGRHAATLPVERAQARVR